MQTQPHYDRVPIFYNLTQMELFFNLMEVFSILKGTSWTKKMMLEHRIWPKKWMWMLEMLQHSPKLQHLIIHEVSHIIWLISWYLFILFNSCSTYLNSCFLFWVEIYLLFTGDRKWDREWKWCWGQLGGPKDCSRMPCFSAQNLLV